MITLQCYFQTAGSGRMAEAAQSETQATWRNIQDALLQGMLSPGVQKFDLSSILQYFIDVHADYRSIKDSSFQMYTRGHIHVCSWKYRNGLFLGDCNILHHVIALFKLFSCELHDII